jgi:hypothetical protein
MTPNYGGVASPVNSLDIPSWGAVQTAIATATLPGTAGTLRNSASDTTSGYLRQKLTTQIATLTTTQVSGLTSVQLSTINAGANEQTALVLNGGYVEGFLPGDVQAAQFTPMIGTGYTIDCTSAGVTINLGGMTTPQVGQKFKYNSYGAYGPYWLGTVVVNGTAQTNWQAGPGSKETPEYTVNGWS